MKHPSNVMTWNECELYRTRLAVERMDHRKYIKACTIIGSLRLTYFDFVSTGFTSSYHKWRLGLAVRRYAGKQKDLGSIPIRLSSLQRVWPLGTVFVTLPLTTDETLKWLSSLPVLMKQSLWWRQPVARSTIVSPHSQHRLPAPTSKLCQNWTALEKCTHLYEDT